MKLFTTQCYLIGYLISLGGIICVSSIRRVNSSDNSYFLPSTTSGKASQSLRNILNEERLLRLSMEQKMQTLMMDVAGNKQMNANFLEKLEDVTKTLQTFETKQQGIEEENSKLKEELKIMRSTMCNFKNLMGEVINSFNITEILMSRVGSLSLQKEHCEQTLKNTDMKAQPKDFIKLNETTSELETACMQSKTEFKQTCIKEKDLNSLKNANSILEQKYRILSMENKGIQKKMIEINETVIKDRNAKDFLTRLQITEENFESFSIFVNRSIQHILEVQKIVNKRLDSISEKLQSPPPSNNGIAFYAYMSQNTQWISGRQRLIFDVIRINAGHAYHSDSGVFRVPETGLYVLTWTIRCNDNQFHSTQLMVGYADVGVMHTYVSSRNDVPGTGIVVERVTKGTLVYVRTHLYWNSGIIVSNNAGRSSFAGWKLD